MKTSIYTLLVFVCLLSFGCDNGKNCVCTTSYSGPGSENLSESVDVIEPFNASSNPDCSALDSVVDESGLVTTVTCVKE